MFAILPLLLTLTASQLPAQAPTVVHPRLVQEHPAAYTRAAFDAKVEGQVVLVLTIGSDGLVERAQVVRSLDKTHGLDEQAMFAVSTWVFDPASVDGVPVVVDAIAEVDFRMPQQAPREPSSRPSLGQDRGCLTPLEPASGYRLL